eukprot:TRINITY_DN8869_c0_g1_i1.p1 TRINITY_DN8869_c0_g1~~TRINITY_DN8869_c0_g1_i1.p1  ORF type:complete len:301 (+),score=37.23 TRINITY_DN8869_c0_g1_i1:110-1012(+)
MQEDSKIDTVNNMQNDNEDRDREDDTVEHSIYPGPSVLNWRKVAPNSLTALANAVGLSAMILGMQGKFDIAVFCILCAGMLDGLDGPVARVLGGTSRFGAEFDSLSDYVNFGVSPGVLLYHWSLIDQGWLGWGICLLYIICMGCRLARFNAGVDFNASPVTRSFFMGVPAPAGAMLVVTPIGCSYLFKMIYPQIPEALFHRPEIIVPWTSVVAFLLVSRLPTFSSKMINKKFIGPITPVKIIFISAVVVSFLAFFVYAPWVVLCGCSFGYVISMPFSYLTFKSWTETERKQAAAQKKKGK